MFIPTLENYTEMTPTEFEQYVVSTLKEQFKQEGVETISFSHDIQKDAHDGNYQIDGEIKISVMGIEIDILIECKRYKGPIKREQIQSLNDKIRSIGAHKGIFVTTSYFQSGALKYAKEHGIALISIINDKLRYEARSEGWMNNPVVPPWIQPKAFSMIMQTQITENSISSSYIDDSDALFRFVVQSEGGTMV